MNWRFKSLVLPFVFLLISLFLYTLFYYNKTLSRISFAGQNVSHLTYAQLSVMVSAKISKFESEPIIIEIKNGNGQSVGRVETDLNSLGIAFDIKATSSRIYQIGKSGDLTDDLAAKLQALFLQKNVLPVYYFDASEFSVTLGKILTDWEVLAKDATIKLGDVAQIIPDERGQIVDRMQLLVVLRQRLNDLDSHIISATLADLEPLVVEEGAQRALARVKILNNQKIILSYDRDLWQLSGNTLFKILRFYPVGQEAGYIYKASFGSVNAKVRNIVWLEREPPILDVSIDKQALEDFIGGIAKSINQETVDATIVFDAGRVSKFTPARDGRRLNEVDTKQAILAQLSTSSVNVDKIIEINLPVAVTRAKIANSEVNSLGIKELIGSGVSYFAGSIANRVHNLSLGAVRVSGTIIRPGESFSFNKAIGDVSEKTGYKKAYVISEGRTVLDDGGGICQVSTTVFRAALDAGLPIIARTAHAYRVGYYEQRGFKAGLDATVWAPAVDFIFKNDTDHHILVQATVGNANAKLQVDIYGTDDDRRVEMSDPVLSKIQAAPEDKYQDDPTLLSGTIKQVDFAAAGATSVFRRKVYRGDTVVIDESYKSVYRPWQAVYLVGTGG